MGKEVEILKGLESLAAKHGPDQTAVFTVVSVDPSAMTCDVKDDEDVEYLVRLAPILTPGQSLLIYPRIGKRIVADRLENSPDWYLSWAEQWTKCTYTIGNCTFETDGTKWTIKNGTSNLLDILTNIIEAIQPIVVLYGNNPDYSKLTDAQTFLNQLLQ